MSTPTSYTPPVSAANLVAVMERMTAPAILEALADGAYVTDTNRRILSWNKAAERITGWPAATVVGRTCYDNILVHIDKDGHRLCGHEHCPLHRSIVSGESSDRPMLVFAQCSDGRRVPVEVTVAPIRDQSGEVVGGIELFRDQSESLAELRRAGLIQHQMVHSVLAPDPRITLEVCYTPCELVGGDFYRVERLGDDRYVVLLADVMGHGVASALYTMQLRSLWEDHRELLAQPSAFLGMLNRRLCALASESGYFATAVAAVANAATGRIQVVRAGHPPLLVLADGTGEEGYRLLGDAQPALGMIEDTIYEEQVGQLEPRETLLFFTDGAIEIVNGGGEEIGLAGFAARADALRDPDSRVLPLAELEETLLVESQKLGFSDDLTLVALRRNNPVD